MEGDDGIAERAQPETPQSRRRPRPPVRRRGDSTGSGSPHRHPTLPGRAVPPTGSCWRSRS